MGLLPDLQDAAQGRLPEFDFDDFRVTTGFALKRAKVVVQLLGRLNAGKHRE
jgi:hypothetical protein